jgi:putative PIN family toxin of toxin-antitoxin system
LRVVLDSNVVLSALLFRRGRLAWIREAWIDGRLAPVVSRETAAELVRALAYDKFNLSLDEQATVFATYIEYAEVVPEPKARVPVCRDPKDLPFLQLAYAAKAEALVTGDADLTAVRSRVPIITPAELREKLEASRGT